MPDASGSDGCGRAAAGSGAGLDSLSNPQLAAMTAAELVVHLHGDRRGSSFADVALVLSTRERSAADAEARIREVAGRLRDEIRRAADTEARLRAEIRALGGRPDDEADARVRPRPSGASEEGGAAAGVDLEPGEIEADDELGAHDDPAAAASEEDGGVGGADVDPDDALTLNQYLEKVKLQQRGNNNDDASENLRALEIVPSSHEDPELDVAPLEVALPGTDLWFTIGDHYDYEPQNSDQSLPGRAVGSMGSSEPEVEGAGDDDDSTSFSDTETSPVGMNSEAGGGGIAAEPSSSTVPARAPYVAREKGFFYNMVLKALRDKEREERALAEAAASQKPNLRCWLYAPLPSESSAEVEEDPHGKAPQK